MQNLYLCNISLKNKQTIWKQKKKLFTSLKAAKIFEKFRKRKTFEKIRDFEIRKSFFKKIKREWVLIIN